MLNSLDHCLYQAIFCSFLSLPCEVEKLNLNCILMIVNWHSERIGGYREQNSSVNQKRKKKLNLIHKVKWIFKFSQFVLYCRYILGCSVVWFFFFLQKCLALQNTRMVYGIEQSSSPLKNLTLLRSQFSLLTMVVFQLSQRTGKYLRKKRMSMYVYT